MKGGFILNYKSSHLLYFFAFILLLFSYPSTSYATEKESDYQKVSNQILVSSYDMEGKPGWYICTTNCEPWGLKKGQWHKHLGDFKWEGHKPTAPVEIYETDQKGTALEKIVEEPKIDKEALIKEGFEKGSKMGYQDGVAQNTYKDELTDAQEFIIQGYKDGYKAGYEKGKKETEIALNEMEIQKKGQQDGYNAYRYGTTINHLASEDKSYSTMPIYQQSFDKGWKQAQQEFYQKFPFMKWFEWNYQGITILHIVGVGILLVAYVVIKVRKAKKKKLEDDIYTKNKKGEKEKKIK